MRNLNCSLISLRYPQHPHPSESLSSTSSSLAIISLRNTINQEVVTDFCQFSGTTILFFVSSSFLVSPPGINPSNRKWNKQTTETGNSPDQREMNNRAAFVNQLSKRNNNNIYNWLLGNVIQHVILNSRGGGVRTGNGKLRKLWLLYFTIQCDFN